MKAVILRKPLDLMLGDMPDPGAPGPGQVRVRVGAVGICGSDIHYYEHGRIGDFVVRAPLVLGHETAGTVEATSAGVTHLKAGDRVAMEPGVPCGGCRACRTGRYNLCPDVKFWATPPVHGSLTEYVVHPASFTYRLPDSMSLAEGALMEPLAVGVYSCNRGRVRPGDVVVVNGAGTIGCVTVLVALAYGASQVIVADVVPERLARVKSLGASVVIDARKESLADAVLAATHGRGADAGVECSGHPEGVRTLVRSAAPAGRVVLVGMGQQPQPVDIVAAQVKEVDLLPVFRYANVYQSAIDLVASGRVKVSPLVTDRFKFADAVKAFEYARQPRPDTCKVMIEV